MYKAFISIFLLFVVACFAQTDEGCLENACAAALCPSPSICIEEEVTCVRAPCCKVPNCIPLCGNDVCSDDEECVTHPCLVAPCPQECKKKATGCLTCATVKCRAPAICRDEEVSCDSPPCCTRPRCIPLCGDDVCADDEECVTNPCLVAPCPQQCEKKVKEECLGCKTAKCSAGYKCITEKVDDCDSPPCCPSVRCAPLCGEDVCSDDETCVTNPCLIPPCPQHCEPKHRECLTCATVKCAAPAICINEEVRCKRPPCCPNPKCIPLCGDDVCSDDEECVTNQCREPPCPQHCAKKNDECSDEEDNEDEDEDEDEDDCEGSSEDPDEVGCPEDVCANAECIAPLTCQPREVVCVRAPCCDVPECV